jgi:zinc transporter
MLTMVTVLALPINLISGLFGMNVGGTPMGAHPAGFWIVAGFITTLTVVIGVLTVRGVRRRR